MNAISPQKIEIIADMLAISWNDNTETFLPQQELRAMSPSAETTGERDLLGKKLGGEWGRSYDGVTLLNWEIVGGYALKLSFSDGHNSGIYSYEYLRALGRELGA